MAGTFPNGWSEVALVSVELEGGTPYQYAALTETIDISEPDFMGETGAKVLSGGRLWKETVHPEEDGEVTLELYPKALLVASSEGLFQHYGGQEWAATKQWDSTQPLTTQFASYPDGVYIPREKFAVCVLWTDDTNVTSATQAVTTDEKVALRFWAKECRIVSHKSSFTDGILKTTVTFRFPAANKQGDTRNFAWESTNDADAANLAAITY